MPSDTDGLETAVSCSCAGGGHCPGCRYLRRLEDAERADDDARDRELADLRAQLARAEAERETFRKMLNECHPWHPQPDICPACKMLGRAPRGGLCHPHPRGLADRLTSDGD